MEPTRLEAGGASEGHAAAVAFDHTVGYTFQHSTTRIMINGMCKMDLLFTNIMQN